jgi:hypothetical protein
MAENRKAEQVSSLVAAAAALGALFLMLNDRREFVEVRPIPPPVGTDLVKMYAGVVDPLNVEFFDIVNMGARPIHVERIDPPELLLSLGESREIPPGGFRTVHTVVRGGMSPSFSGTMMTVHTTRGAHSTNVEVGGILAQRNLPKGPGIVRSFDLLMTSLRR